MDSASNTCSARRACSGRASAGGTCVNGQSATNGLRGAECTNGQVLSTYTSLRERRIYAANAAVQRWQRIWCACGVGMPAGRGQMRRAAFGGILVGECV